MWCIISYLTRGDALLTKTEVSGGWNMEELTGVIYITEDTYARLKGQTFFTTDEREEMIAHFPVSINMGNLVDIVGIVVADEDALEEIYLAQKAAYGE